MAPDVAVHPPSLLTQARVWDEQAATMTSLSGWAGSLTSPGFAWPFTEIVKDYETARALFQRLCGEGGQEMQRIASALIAAYQGYNNTEQNIIHDIAGDTGQPPKPHVHDIAGDQKPH